MKLVQVILFVFLLAVGGQTIAEQAIGKVAFVTGTAYVQTGTGAKVKLEQGNAIYVGQTLSTGNLSHVHLNMVDGGFVGLRPNAEVLIKRYTVDLANPANTQIQLDVRNGVVRSVTGKGGQSNKSGFRLNTPVAAIGIRGTDFTVYTDRFNSSVSIRRGGVVVSPFSPWCSREALGGCDGEQAVTLSAGVNHNVVAEVSAAQENAILVSADQTQLVPDQVQPAHPTEDKSVQNSQPLPQLNGSAPSTDAGSSGSDSKKDKTSSSDKTASDSDNAGGDGSSGSTRSTKSTENNGDKSDTKSDTGSSNSTSTSTKNNSTENNNSGHTTSDSKDSNHSKTGTASSTGTSQSTQSGTTSSGTSTASGTTSSGTSTASGATLSGTSTASGATSSGTSTASSTSSTSTSTATSSGSSVSTSNLGTGTASSTNSSTTTTAISAVSSGSTAEVASLTPVTSNVGAKESLTSELASQVIAEAVAAESVKAITSAATTPTTPTTPTTSVQVFSSKTKQTPLADGEHKVAENSAYVLVGAVDNSSIGARSGKREFALDKGIAAVNVNGALQNATITDPKLSINFDNNTFDTTLNVKSDALTGGSVALNASGTVGSNAVLTSNAATSNMTVAGALSNDANHAGYVFEQTATGIVGATTWQVQP